MRCRPCRGILRGATAAPNDTASTSPVNRQVNSALHIVHVTQARMHEPAKSYLARRKNDGKTPREARRCDKRQLANVLIRHAPGKLVEGQTVTGWKAAFGALAVACPERLTTHTN